MNFITFGFKKEKERELVLREPLVSSTNISCQETTKMTRLSWCMVVSGDGSIKPTNLDCVQFAYQLNATWCQKDEEVDY